MKPMKWMTVALVMCGTSLFGDAARAEDAIDVVTSTYKEQIVVERTTTTREVQVKPKVQKEKYKVAIFVANRTKIVDDKVLVMQDLVNGYATDKGFSIISREDVINSVAKLAPDAGPNKGRRDLPGGDMDAILSNNTSALALASNLGADYVLMVSLTTFGTDKQRYTDRAKGIDLVMLKHQLRATYKVLDTTVGGSMTAGVATVTITDRTNPNQNLIERENLVDDLLDGAALDMAGMLGAAARADAIKPVAGAADEATFTVHTAVADLFYPEIVKNENGEQLLGAGRYRLEAMSVAVEVDGVLVGTSPGPFKVKPGLHKLRLRREMFKDWEATVKIGDKAVLTLPMKMTEEGYQRFGDMAKLMADLKTNQALTDAQVKVWEGYAKQLEGSTIKIDKQIKQDLRGTLPDIRDRDRNPIERDLKEPKKGAGNE
jgi:hypothetical protein